MASYCCSSYGQNWSCVSINWKNRQNKSQVIGLMSPQQLSTLGCFQLIILFSTFFSNFFLNLFLIFFFTFFLNFFSSTFSQLEKKNLFNFCHIFSQRFLQLFSSFFLFFFLKFFPIFSQCFQLIFSAFLSLLKKKNLLQFSLALVPIFGHQLSLQNLLDWVFTSGPIDHTQEHLGPVKNGTFWEFFPNVGPPYSTLLGTPVSPKKYMVYFSF